MEIYEDVVRWDSSEGNGKSNPCVDRVGVQREKDHEEAREGEHHWNEEWDLWTSQE